MFQCKGRIQTITDDGALKREGQSMKMVFSCFHYSEEQDLTP